MLWYPVSMKTRQQALDLLYTHTKTPNLRKHALAVEAAMRAYARKYGENEELWGITGLLHDLDYEQNPTPDKHPLVGIGILQEQGYPEEVIYAIKSHAEYLGVPRRSPMDKTLFAVDELAGFIVAVALVKPRKSLAEVDPPSVRKKLKDKAFARSVNRDDIIQGAADLEVDLDEHIAFVIQAMSEIAGNLGLAPQNSL